MGVTSTSVRRIQPPFRYVDNTYFQDGRLFTGVLASLLYLLVATSLDAAGYVSSLVLLVPVTLGALAVAFLMSFSRFDGFFALSHSMFTGLAWILFLMTGLVGEKEIEPFVANGIPPLQAESYYVLLKWLNWVDAALSEAASADNFVFIFEIAFLVWWLTFLGVWAIFRYGYTWRAVVPAAMVLLINTYYAPNSILGFLIVFSLVAMVLLIRTNLAEQQLRWREQRVYFSQDITLDFLRTGFMYSVIILALAWIAPGLGRNVQVRSILAPINSQWEETTQRMNRLYQGINRQTRPVSSTFGRSLTLGGARNVGNSLVLQVQTPLGRYWRAVTYDTFNGQQWLNTAQEEASYAAEETLPVASWELRQPITQTVTLLAPTGDVIFGAPDIQRADLPLAALVRSTPGMAPLEPMLDEDGAPLAEGQELTFARARRGLEAGNSYTVVSRYTTVTELALREAVPDYAPAIIETYLQLPEEVSPRVVQLAAELTAGQPTVYDQAKAVETYLRGIPYNEEIPAPPAAQDPVDWFLFDLREGYCDYYASAMAVMLRSQGIPARTASGYAEGALDQETGLYLINERDAHTWVEVYFPGLGWIEFEPTAGESALSRPRGEDPSSASAAAGALGPTNPQSDEDLLNPGGGPIPEDLGDEGLDDIQATDMTTWPWWLWTGLTLLAAAVGLLLVWRTRAAGPTTFTPDMPPLFFERMQRWAARVGIAARDHDTPYEHARALGGTLPQGRPFIDEITQVYVRYRFGRHGAAATQATDEAGLAATGTRLTEAWQRLQPILVRAWASKAMRVLTRR